MITECTVHGMILSCSTPAAHGEIATWFKDFGPIICSVASFWLAYRVSRITREQKEINKSAYNLNLFKERFAIWNDFQAKKDTVIHIKRVFLFYKYTENSDELREFRKNVFEVENILKKIIFLFVSKNTPEKFNDIISHIKYNMNILNNAKEYRRIFEERVRLNRICNTAMYYDEHIYKYYGINNYISLYNFVNEIINSYEFLKKLFVFNCSEMIISQFLNDCSVHVVEYEELGNDIFSLSEDIDEMGPWDEEGGDRLIEKEALVEKYRKCKERLEEIKESYKDILSEVYALHEKMKERIMDDEKKYEEILEKTNIDDDRKNIRDERFFNSVSNFMQYYLRIGG